MNNGPWSGADQDKADHPRLGRLVDNIWILVLNRIGVPLLGTAITAAIGFAYTKLDTLNDLARDVPKLAQIVEKLSDKADKQAETQAVMIDHIKQTEKDVATLRTDVVQSARDLGETNIRAAAMVQRLSDLTEAIGDIKKLATENLAVSKSHTPAIEATRAALAPPSSR